MSGNTVRPGMSVFSKNTGPYRVISAPRYSSFHTVALVDEYKRNGDSENIAHLKAQNALLPLYRKELRKVLLEYLQWMRAMKKDYTFQKVIETQKDLKDTDGFDWLESTELAIDKRQFLLNRLFVKQPIPQDED